MVMSPSHQSIETEIDVTNPENIKTVIPGQVVTNADPIDPLDIEIVDDTPERDRGKARKEPLPEAPKGVIPDDEELAQYSDTVQKRIKKISYEYHEQRRLKEAAERQVEEAARVAKSLYEHNQNLMRNLKSGEQSLVEQARGRVESQINQAKNRLRKAHEEGNTEELVNAQEELAGLMNQRAQVDNYRPQYQQEAAPPPVAPPKPTVPSVDSRTAEWSNKNPWFQKDTVMTATAFGLHQKLVNEQGIDPRSNPETYYAELDKGMRKYFPNHDWPDKQVQPEVRRQVSSVVAPAQRTNASISSDGRKVSLTASQVSLAKRLGLTPQQYAVELVKQMKDN